MIEHIERFVEAVQTKLDAYRNAHFSTLPRTILQIEKSSKWAKIVVLENGIVKRVYGFVALKAFETKSLGAIVPGDIHMAATFKAPAKHARGSVFKPETWTCAGPYGIEYLKGPSIGF